MPHHDPEMVRPVDSNGVIASLRHAEGTSRLLRCLEKIRRIFRGSAPAEPSALSKRMTPRAARSDFKLVDELVMSSRLMAGLESLFALSVVIAREAAVVRVWSTGLGAIRALARWQRVRLLGWLLGIAVLTHVLLAAGDIVESRGTLLVVPAAALLAAVGLLGGSRALASAWEQRRISRPGSE